MRYIATQAPIPQTFADFWNLIWEQKIAVIVMLVEIQRGRVKALLFLSRRPCFSAKNIGQRM